MRNIFSLFLLKSINRQCDCAAQVFRYQAPLFRKETKRPTGHTQDVVQRTQKYAWKLRETFLLAPLLQASKYRDIESEYCTESLLKEARIRVEQCTQGKDNLYKSTCHRAIQEVQATCLASQRKVFDPCDSYTISKEPKKTSDHHMRQEHGPNDQERTKVRRPFTNLLSDIHCLD